MRRRGRRRRRCAGACRPGACVRRDPDGAPRPAEEAREGRGQVVLVAVDAGLGKSRLPLEFHRALDHEGIDVTWLEGRCILFGQSIAFAPLVDRLRQNFGIVRALSLRGAGRRPLVLTHRIEYTPPFGGRTFVTNLTLRNLNPTESLEIAKRVLGIQEVLEPVRAALLEKAEGVPLFVEEVTTALLDLGVLARSSDGYRVAKSLAEVGVPDTVQGIIMARLDRLRDDGKRTVQFASVIGRQFMHRLLERLAGHPGRLDAAGADRMDEARAAAAEARATIERLAARAPESALRQTFLAGPRVQAALEEAQRLRAA